MTSSVLSKSLGMLSFIILFLSATVLGSSITNGTCYWKAGEEADSIYSPCGNAIDGNWPCCQLGDKCNDHNACTWQNGSGPIYTYVAGCTDPTYQDDSCPDKGNFSAYQWVGLAWSDCGGDTSGPLVDWYGCSNDGSARVQVSKQSENCDCDERDDQPLLSQVSKGLVAMGYLPTSKMGEITWEPGWSRTDPAAPSSTSSSSISTKTLSPATSLIRTPTSSSSTTSSTTNSSGSIATPASTSAAAATDAADNSGSSSNMDTGSKIGIGIGFAVLGLVAIFLAFGMFIKKRKPKPKTPAVVDTPVPAPTPEPAMLDSASTGPSPTPPRREPIRTPPELHGSPTVFGTISPASASPIAINDDGVVYRPFRYQSVDAEEMSEAPSREERNNFAAVAYAAYKNQEAVNDQLANARARESWNGGEGEENGSRNAHELPA